MRIAALVLDRARGLEDGASLHLGDLREGDAETAAAQPEHRILLMQLFDARQQRTQLLELGRAGLGVFEVFDLHSRSFRLGRNLCKGGSIVRMTTGSPSIDLNRPAKSARCMGKSFFSAALRSFSLSARIMAR